MKLIALIIAVLSFQNISGQTLPTQDGSFNISYKSSNIISEYSFATSVTPNSSKIHILKIKLIVKSADKTSKYFDLNPFSLIDSTLKYRVRPVDANYPFLTTYAEFNKLIKGSPGNQSWTIPYFYKPEIEDSFTDYHFEGIENTEFPINFGGSKVKDRRVIYYEPVKFSKKNVILFFPVRKNSKEVKLYYGEDLLIKIDL